MKPERVIYEKINHAPIFLPSLGIVIPVCCKSKKDESGNLIFLEDIADNTGIHVLSWREFDKYYQTKEVEPTPEEEWIAKNTLVSQASMPYHGFIRSKSKFRKKENHENNIALRNFLFYHRCFYNRMFAR